MCVETVIYFFSVQGYYSYANAAFTSSCKKTATFSSAKLKEDRILLIEQSTTGTSVSLVAPYICGYIDIPFV